MNGTSRVPKFPPISLLGWHSSVGHEQHIKSASMTSQKKRIAVIGGGLAGIAVTKAMKEEGLEPVCFEKTPHFGGTWRYHDDDVEGLASVMWTTVLNHSKEMGAISDFPPKKEYPNYMRHFEVYEMFREYGETFDVFKHFLFNREVVRVRKAKGYEENGQWTVSVKNIETGETTDQVFDGVVVGTGQFSHPKMVEFPGMENFHGSIIHTHSLKKVDGFAGQRILVVGIGCSGLDAAVETSNVARQVYLSTRSGAWVVPRVSPHGLPSDFNIFRGYNTFLQNNIPTRLLSKWAEVVYIDNKFDHELYNLKPKHHVLAKDPALNDVIACKIITGAVKIRKDISHFTEKGVLFQGEKDVTEVDTVILATGYDWKFPFLDDDIIVSEPKGKIHLYKGMYPAQLPHPTLVMIGFILPFGSGIPPGEMQCRWAAHLMSGKGKLPSNEAMMTDIERHYKTNTERYEPSDKLSLKVSFVPYLDDLASQFGAKPNMLKMAFRDPRLFLACLFGPCVPYQYRLEGPHSWPGARDAILTAEYRMRYPLSGEKTEKKGHFSQAFILKYLLALLTMFVFLSWKDSSVEYYLMAMFLLFSFLWKNLIYQLLSVLFMLAFFVTWQGFTTHYLGILCVLILLSTVTIIGFLSP